MIKNNTFNWSSIRQVTIVACLMIMISATFTACAPENRKPSPSAKTSPLEIVPVEQLLQNPKNYTGIFCVEGIVSEVAAEQKMFAIIDNQEYLLCGTTGCALLTLPVQWAGTMPHIEDAVQVTGEVYYQDRKLVFIGQKLDITHRK